MNMDSESKPNQFYFLQFIMLNTCNAGKNILTSYQWTNINFNTSSLLYLSVRKVGNVLPLLSDNQLNVIIKIIRQKQALTVHIVGHLELNDHLKLFRWRFSS